MLQNILIFPSINSYSKYKITFKITQKSLPVFPNNYYLINFLQVAEIILLNFIIYLIMVGYWYGWYIAVRLTWPRRVRAGVWCGGPWPTFTSTHRLRTRFCFWTYTIKRIIKIANLSWKLKYHNNLYSKLSQI